MDAETKQEVTGENDSGNKAGTAWPDAARSARAGGRLCAGRGGRNAGVHQRPAATENGVLRKGKLGEDMTVEEGYEAARIAALNCLAVVKSLAGSLDRVERVVKVVGFVNCTPDFEAQPKVINGASELLGQVFGDAGLHARSAVGVSSLPLGACCEVELIVRLKP